MAEIRHGTLVAITVTEVELPNRNFGTIEVMNRSGSAEIYFLVLNPANSSTDPTIGGENCEVLPAAISALQVNAPDPAPVTVKLISSGTPTYSIRAE